MNLTFKVDISSFWINTKNCFVSIFVNYLISPDYLRLCDEIFIGYGIKIASGRYT